MGYILYMQYFAKKLMKFNSYFLISKIIKNQNSINMHISAKQQVPILKTVGGVFRTIRVTYMQYYCQK